MERLAEQLNQRQLEGTMWEVPHTFPEEWVDDVELDQRQRHKDDTETWLAEALNGSMRTLFNYTFDGNNLRSHDGGDIGEIFDDSIRSAREIVKQNPSLLFELRRRLIEKEEYDEMLMLAKGELQDEGGESANTMVVISDFPPELCDSKGDVGGYNVARQQTMLRVISREQDGSVNVTTQSLDGSNRRALEAIYRKLGVEPETGELLGQRITLSLPNNLQGQLVNNLTEQYDDSLREQFGGSWQSGIRQHNQQTLNTYEFTKMQTDLVEWFVQEKIQNPERAEKLRYDLAATVDKRWRDYCSNNDSKENNLRFVGNIPDIQLNRHLMDEILQASAQAQASGRVFSGCGASVGSSGTAGELSQSGYGNKSDEDEYGPLTFKCTEGHTNTRPKGKLISKCSTKDCRGTVGC